MKREGFEVEDKIVDEYVEIKESGGDGDHLIEKLVTDFFIAQNRFIEANSWLEALTDSKTSIKLKKLIAEAEERNPQPNLSRIPKNKNWVNADVLNSAVKSEDQQSHYDRLVAMANLKQVMLEDVDDVIECRNEWITFVAKNSFTGGMQAKGATMNTIATAYRDYIENILIPDKFVETETHRQIAESQKPKHLSVEQAYVNFPETIEYLRTHHAPLLNDGFNLHFYCQTKIMGSSEEIIVTDNYLALLPAKKKGWGVGDGIIISRDNISQISVGSEFHTEYQGLITTQSNFWTLTFETTNFQQFTRYLYLGKNENEMNQNRPIHGQTIQQLGELFQLVEGDSFVSSGGYRTTFGYGWWV